MKCFTRPPIHVILWRILWFMVTLIPKAIWMYGRDVAGVMAAKIRSKLKEDATNE